MAYNLRTGLIGSGDIDINVSLNDLNAANITTGVFSAGVIPELSKDKIANAGSWAETEIPTLPKAKIGTDGTWDASDIPDLDASKLTSGTIASGRLSLVSNDIPELLTTKMDLGSYHALQLRNHLATKLNAHSVSVTFSETSSKFTFTMANPVGTNALVFGENGAHSLLGFSKNSTNTFAASTLTSTGAVSMMFSDALYLHCDLLNTNVDKRAGDKSSFHLSTAFAKIAINTSPFNNIIFQNANDDYMLNIIDRRVSELHFWVTTVEHGIITLNDDFSFTLKVEVFEDDEKTLVSQNSGLGELMRLMLLQHHVFEGKKSED